MTKQFLTESWQSGRTPVCLDAHITAGNKTYKGYIKNLSDFTLTAQIQTSNNFSPRMHYLLNFQLSPGKTLELECELLWFFRTTPHYMNVFLGLEILTGSAKYNDFITSLNAATKIENRF